MTEIRYNWNDLEFTNRQNQIARDISQMLLFGSDVKNIKSKLKEMGTAKLSSSKKKFLPNSKFCYKKSKEMKKDLNL